jgi:hypothetical protein
MNAQKCPWCERWATKEGCDFIFACGLTPEGFKIGQGCGKTWCFKCGKKYCGQYINAETGAKLKDARDHHGDCCEKEAGFKKEEFCAGGCSSHCKKRYV